MKKPVDAGGYIYSMRVALSRWWLVATLLSSVNSLCTAQVPRRESGEDSATYVSRALAALTMHGDRMLHRADSLYSAQDLQAAKLDYVRATLSLTSGEEHAKSRLREIARQERFGHDMPDNNSLPRPAHSMCQAFQLAAERDDVEEVRRMLAVDPSVLSSLDNHGSSPLHAAVDSSALNVMVFVLGQGADVAARDSKGRITLHRARHSEAVRLLVKHGADISSRDHGGFTPLISYEDRGDPSLELQSVLIELGSDVNARAHDGTTPLMRACAAGNYDLHVIGSLISAGADVNARDDHGLGPLDHALRYYRDDLAAFLRSRGSR